MGLSLEAIAVLDAIDRRGSFAAAAVELDRVPSAITYTVRRLEESLDALLFDRRGKRARFTPAGRELLANGRRLLAEASALESRIHRISTGWEADLAYSPEFFEGDDDDIDLIDNSNVTSFMANVLVGVPVGGQTGAGVRPYFAGGLGVLQTQVQGADDLFEVDNSEFGINLGGGIMGFATDHVGFRGDLRYYRALSDPEEDNEFDIDFGDFDFWRGTVGVTFRW